MTTKITIETGRCPVALHQNSTHSYDSPTFRNSSYQDSSEFIPANSTFVTHASDNVRVGITELPEEFNSLDGPGLPIESNTFNEDAPDPSAGL